MKIDATVALSEDLVAALDSRSEGCLSEGEPREEALVNFKEAIALNLEPIDLPEYTLS